MLANGFSMDKAEDGSEEEQAEKEFHVFFLV